MNLSRKFIGSILMLALASCSTSVERVPAGDDKDLFTRVFTLASVDNVLVEDQKENFLTQILYEQEGIELEVVEDKTLGDGNAFRIELDVNEKTKKYIYRVLHAPAGFRDLKATNYLVDYINALKKVYYFHSPYATFEAYYNAKRGDPIAIEIFYKFRPYSKFYNDEDSKALEIVKKEIKALRAERKTEKEKRKKPLVDLDNAPEGKQFKTLVAINDRKGAADVLRKYLPWEEMAPFEKKYWETYLDVMENPVPLDQRVIIYRGLGEDNIYRGMVNGQVLTEKEAFLQSNAFIMSPVLDQNNGSSNRRLRSLETMNGKTIATVLGVDEYTQSARVSTMFYNHAGNPEPRFSFGRAGNPEGSPFLTLTPSFEAADKAAGNKSRMAALAVDPRIINFNFASRIPDEYKFLTALTTFPDELVAMTDTDYLPEYNKPSAIKAYFDLKLAQKVSAQYGDAKAEDVTTKMKKNSYKFFKSEYPLMKNYAGPSPSASNLRFSKQLADTSNVPLKMTPSGSLTCNDLIQLFW